MQDHDDESVGDAAQAFEALRAEVSVLRRAVETLPGAWKDHKPPDYTATLGKIAQSLEEVNIRLENIEQHPALQLTPEQHQRAIASAGGGLMSDAAVKLNAATEATESHGRHLAGLIGTARQQDQQLKWLAGTGAVALVVGLLISPFLARWLPFGWDTRVAATVLHTDRWNAGQALMQSTNPMGWATLAAEINLVEPNHAALTACREAAARTKKEQRCAIVVLAP